MLRPPLHWCFVDLNYVFLVSFEIFGFVGLFLHLSNKHFFCKFRAVKIIKSTSNERKNFWKRMTENRTKLVGCTDWESEAIPSFSFCKSCEAYFQNGLLSRTKENHPVQRKPLSNPAGIVRIMTSDLSGIWFVVRPVTMLPIKTIHFLTNWIRSKSLYLRECWWRLAFNTRLWNSKRNECSIRHEDILISIQNSSC